MYKCIFVLDNSVLLWALQTDKLCWPISDSTWVGGAGRRWEVGNLGWGRAGRGCSWVVGREARGRVGIQQLCWIQALLPGRTEQSEATLAYSSLHHLLGDAHPSRAFGATVALLGVRGNVSPYPAVSQQQPPTCAGYRACQLDCLFQRKLGLLCNFTKSNTILGMLKNNNIFILYSGQFVQSSLQSELIVFTICHHYLRGNDVFEKRM